MAHCRLQHTLHYIILDRPFVEAIKQSTTFVDALGHMGGPGDGFGRRRSSGHARAAAETAGCRLGRRRSRRRARIGMRRPARAGR